MNRLSRREKGFTLVEMLVVVAIFGVIMGAVYSLYLAHQRAAYKQQDVMELQQNLVIGMDSLIKDIRMNGFLVTKSETQPYVSTLGNYSSQVTLYSASSLATNTMQITKDIATVAGPTLGPISVDSADSLSWFHKNDTVRIIRTSTASFIQPILADNQKDTATTSIFTIYTTSSGTPSVTLARSPDFPADVDFKAGDLIVKVSGGNYPESISYVVEGCDGSEDPIKCLKRTAGGATQSVARYITGLHFSYIMDDNTETNTPSADQINDDLRAIKVTLTGQTTKKVSPTDTTSTRQLTTIVNMRNRRL